MKTQTGGTSLATARDMAHKMKRRRRKKNKRPARAPYDTAPQNYNRPGVPF